MYTSFDLNKLGFKGASLTDNLALAQKYGFDGIDVNIAEVAQLVEQRGLEAVRSMFTEANVKPSLSGIPYPWSRGEEDFQKCLQELPRLAKLARDIGMDRFITGVSPHSEQRPYDENFAFHAERCRPVAQILRDHGCRLGIEFIAPKTLRQGKKYEFIYSFSGVMELADAVGTGNVGALLDCWHWYTSHETLDALANMTNDQVIAVHVNDAPAGIPIDEQIDSARCMPLETGVIDIEGFMDALKRANYDGPITVEPFNKRIQSLSPDEAAAETIESLRALWKVAGLS